MKSLPNFHYFSFSWIVSNQCPTLHEYLDFRACPVCWCRRDFCQTFGYVPVQVFRHRSTITMCTAMTSLYTPSPTYLHMYIDPFLHLQMSYRNDTFWSEKIRLESGRLCSSIILRVCEQTWSLFGWVFSIVQQSDMVFFPISDWV